MSFATETESIIEQVEVLNEQSSLVLWNDDVNTFEHVINSLIDICAHQPEQAEQCAFIVHFKGKCEIKRGRFYKLLPLKDALQDRGLTAEINK